MNSAISLKADDRATSYERELEEHLARSLVEKEELVRTTMERVRYSQPPPHAPALLATNILVCQWTVRTTLELAP
jgi:hypothetical protein